MNALFQKIERMTTISCFIFVGLVALLTLPLYEPESNQIVKTGCLPLVMLIISVIVAVMFFFFVEKIKKEIGVFIDENEKESNKKIKVLECFVEVSINEMSKTTFRSFVCLTIDNYIEREEGSLPENFIELICSSGDDSLREVLTVEVLKKLSYMNQVLTTERQKGILVGSKIFQQRNRLEKILQDIQSVKDNSDIIKPVTFETVI